MLSGMVAASDCIASPASEKKLRWVKCRLLTKCCKRIRTPGNSFSSTATQSLFIKNFSLDVTGPRIASAVIWVTWNPIPLNQREHYNYMIHDWRQNILLYRWRRTGKPPCEEHEVETSTMSGRLLVEVRSSCLCSYTKDRCSALRACFSAPFTQRSYKILSGNMLNESNGAWSSSQMSMRGQKQLNFCPIADIAAELEKMQFTKPQGTFCRPPGTYSSYSTS